MENQKPVTNTVQLEIEKRADKKLNDLIDKIDNFLYQGEVGSFIRKSEIKINIGTTESPKKVYATTIFREENLGKEIIKANREIFIEKETRLFLLEVEKKQTMSTLPLDHTDTDKPKEKSEAMKAITSRIAEKEKERQYLWNFLSTVMKGSDIKQKVDRELSVIDSEIKTLKWIENQNPDESNESELPW